MRKRQVVVSRQDTSRNNSSSSSSSNRTYRFVVYKECQKNHAAGVGGYAVDGCREFMATGAEETEDGLVCAACGCHRNFHKKVVETILPLSFSSSSP
ncbi:hypothetical protein QQ045_008004 [Rhodiola kirilowii]